MSETLSVGDMEAIISSAAARPGSDPLAWSKWKADLDALKTRDPGKYQRVLLLVAQSVVCRGG